MTTYIIMAATGGLKTDNDMVRYYVESSDGGGIEYVGGTLEDAVKYVKSVGGTVEEIL